MQRKHRNISALATLSLPALVAIVGALSAPVLADTSVKVELWDKADGSQGIKLSTSEVKAGPVTFVVTNSSKKLEHEFMILKTDMTADQFPVKSKGSKVDEDKLDGMHEFGDVEEGETETWSTELTPGRWVLFCNETGHFKAGMHTTLMVTP